MTILYHGSQPEHRERIRATGLCPTARDDTHMGYRCPRGVYLATDTDEARYFGPDIWAVDTTGLAVAIDPDSYNANGVDDNYYTPQPIPPERLTLLIPGVMTGEEKQT